VPLVTHAEFTSGGRPQGGSIREDLQDFVANVSPRDVPLLAQLRQVKVSGGFVEWQQDSLASRAANAWAEGVAATDQALTTPSRLYNHVQTFATFGYVSDRQRNVEHAGFTDMLLYQERKKFLQLRNDIEHALHRGSAASGTTNVAPQLDGLLNISSTLVSDHSGVTLTEIVFNDILQRSFDYETEPRQAYVGPLLKRTVSGYTTNVTRNIDASRRRQILGIDIYDSDFGTIEIVKSRDQLNAATATTDTANSVMVIDPEMLQTGWLQRIKSERISRDGLRERFQISAEVTLIYRAPEAINGASNVRPNIS
jgi:hypothetical protein